jgi:hypothetical protein
VPIVAELVEKREADVAEGWLGGYRPTPVTEFVAPAAREALAHYGLWRDGDMIVVCRSNHRFPQRCVMTNEPMLEPPRPVELEYLPNRLAWSLCGRWIGRAIGRALYGETIILNACISPGWRQRHWLHRVGGSILLWAGVLMAVPAAALARPRWPRYLPYDGSYEPLANMFTLMFAGLFAAGFIVLLLCRPLCVSIVQGDCVWLRGASAAFIESLPPWPRR